MTWITDNTGTRWVEIQQPKRRKSPRPLRFDNIAVGNQLMLKPQENWWRKIPQYFIVTDLWFDPVDGEEDPTKGRMVALRRIGEDGEPHHRKSKTTVRGLASQQYHYADIDYVAHCKARLAGSEGGAVVGIGVGRALKSRPKIAGL